LVPKRFTDISLSPATHHKSTRIEAQGICFAKIGKTFEKIFPILSVAKYLYPINAPAITWCKAPGASSRGCLGIKEAFALHAMLSSCFGTNDPFSSPSQVVYLLFGGLVAGFTQVIAYFFGSSKSSSDKTKLLAWPKP
jgi:hypothetical protein